MPKTATAPAIRLPIEFVPPRVGVGQVVLWTWTATTPKPSPAIVLAVGNRTLNLSVHVEGTKDHVLKTGVRHAEDPFLLTSPRHDAGVWTLTERDRLLDRLLAGGDPGYAEEE